MGLRFGTQRKHETEVAGSGDYLRSFGKGETKVRFLEEPEEWFSYREHFTPDNKSFPCTRDRETCPGCTSENEKTQRASRKYATNIYLVKNRQVLPFKIPVSLATRLEARAEKNNGTLLNRDYTVMKSGSGLDTEYDVDQEERYELDIDKLRAQGKDVEEILLASYTEIWGAPEDTVKPKKELPKKAPVEDEPIPEALKTKAEREAEKDEVEEITEEALRAMSRADLQKVYAKAGIDMDQDLSTKELAEDLIARFS